MNFNKHYSLEGKHAFLGASKYHWINYSEDKVVDAYNKFLATQKGTILHAYAAQSISLGQKLPKSRKTLNMYVNDAIGFKMTPEQPLFYSENCFGTADAISFRNNSHLPLIKHSPQFLIKTCNSLIKYTVFNYVFFFIADNFYDAYFISFFICSDLLIYRNFP